MGKRVEDVLAALKGAFASGGWHGPTVLESIAGVTAAQARKKPTGAHHSVHELVDHNALWERAAIRNLKTGRAPARPEREWASPRTNFGTSVRRLKDAHRALVTEVACLRETDLERAVKTDGSGAMPLVSVLHGVAAHAAYHAGQIRLIRTLL
jgi:uncharacterized damage-inducible protein DinB